MPIPSHCINRKSAFIDRFILLLHSQHTTEPNPKPSLHLLSSFSLPKHEFTFSYHGRRDKDEQRQRRIHIAVTTSHHDWIHHSHGRRVRSYVQAQRWHLFLGQRPYGRRQRRCDGQTIRRRRQWHLFLVAIVGQRRATTTGCLPTSTTIKISHGSNHNGCQRRQRWRRTRTV